MPAFFENALMNLVAFILVLGPLIFIHELGHFLMAKLLRIRVEVFSLGFGPRLFGFRWGPTDYRVSLLPLGGYVKMRGENPEDARSGDPDEFLSRSKLERFLVLVMGASFNVLLAVILVAFTFRMGVWELRFLEHPVVVGSVESGSPAEEAGLQPGDRIIEIDGEPVGTWKDFQLRVALSPGQSRRLSIVRDGEIVDRRIVLGTTDTHRIGWAGVGPRFAAILTGVQADRPAAQAGLVDGDEILAVDGEPVADGMALVERIQASAGVPLRFRYRRGDIESEIVLTPEERDGRGQIGIYFPPRILKKYSLAGAVVQSLQENWKNSGLLFTSLRKLIVGDLSLRTLSGPVEIFRISGASFRQGPVVFLGTIALLSLNLGIINLLPIPVLDGGHIFVLLVEGLIRRDLSEKLKERLIQAGFLFLVTFMVIIIIFDVLKIGGF